MLKRRNFSRIFAEIDEEAVFVVWTWWFAWRTTRRDSRPSPKDARRQRVQHSLFMAESLDPKIYNLQLKLCCNALAYSIWSSIRFGCIHDEEALLVVRRRGQTDTQDVRISASETECYENGSCEHLWLDAGFIDSRKGQHCFVFKQVNSSGHEVARNLLLFVPSDTVFRIVSIGFFVRYTVCCCCCCCCTKRLVDGSVNILFMKCVHFQRGRIINRPFRWYGINRIFFDSLIHFICEFCDFF